MKKLKELIGTIFIVLIVVAITSKGYKIFKRSDFYKELICMKDTGESRNICKKKISEKKVHSNAWFYKLVKETLDKRK